MSSIYFEKYIAFFGGKNEFSEYSKNNFKFN